MTPANEPFGDFSFLATSFTVLSGPPGAVQMQANFEGRCSGFGFTLGTMSLTRHGRGLGTWSCCTATFPESGDDLTGTAQGNVSSLAPNRWRTQGLLTLSDGREFRVDGELDLERRSWSGQLLPRA